jgi:hypothetical protein
VAITGSGVVTSTAAVAGTPGVYTDSQTIGTSTTYTAKVEDASSDIVVGDPVAFSVVPGTTGETCGTLSTPATTTGSTGIATVTFTAATPSTGVVLSPTCVITIAEADSAAHSTLTVTQAGLAPAVTVTPATSDDALGTADTISVSVANVTSADNGHTVTFSVAGIAVGGVTPTCGVVTPTTTLLVVASGATTGTATASYTAASASGFCTITASVPTAEFTSGSPYTGATTIDQT